MEQIESGHIVIFTVDLAANQPDYHLAGCADDRAVEVSAEHLSPLIARAQVQMAVKSVVHRVDRAGQRHNLKAALEIVLVILLFRNIVHADREIIDCTERQHACERNVLL